MFIVDDIIRSCPLPEYKPHLPPGGFLEANTTYSAKAHPLGEL